MKRHVVPRDWAGEAVAIVASGPSVEGFDFSRIAGLRTVAVKDGHMAANYADVLVIGDHRYAHRQRSFNKYYGDLILYTDSDHPKLPEVWEHDHRIEYIPKVKGRGLSRDPAELRGTFTTVCIAINYAVLRGAKRIYLVGVDGKPGASGRRWFSRDTTEPESRRYARQKWGYNRLPEDLNMLGVKVFNLNPDSDVKTFPAWKDHKL